MVRFCWIYTSLLFFGLQTQRADAQCSTTGRLFATATPTRAAASVPSCSKFTGTSLVITNTTEVDLTGWETIEGDVEILQYENSDTMHVYSPTLRNISGRLHIHSWDSSDRVGTVNLSFPMLEYLGQLYVSGKFDGVSLGFGENTTVEAVHMDSISGFGSPRYTTLFLNVSVVRNVLDSRLRYNGEGDIVENEAHDFFSTVSFFNSSVNIQDNKFRTIVMPQLETAHRLEIGGNGELEQIDLSMVTARTLRVYDNGRRTSLILNRLATLNGRDGGVRHRQFTTTLSDLVSLKLPQLREVNSSNEFSIQNNLFSELHLNHLETVNTTFNILQNSVLIDLSLPRLAYAEGLEVRNNSRLLNFTSNTLQKAGYVWLEGNFTNVELFSLEEVSEDFTLIGSPSMDCSWFDENFFQKVVKGEYECVGNHTKPDVPRRPSTSTDIEEENDGSGSGDPELSSSNTPVPEQDSSLSTGAKAGIGLGAAGVVALLLGIGAFLLRRKKKASSQEGGGMDELSGGKSELDGTSEPKATPSAELDGKVEKAIDSVQEIPGDETWSPAPVELDTKMAERELSDSGVQKEPTQSTVTRSELP